MIRCIAAIDDKRGIANEKGIPWHGKVPTDVKYYTTKIKTGLILMGYGVYKEMKRPYENEYGVNYVATRNRGENLKEGFKPVYDARQFLEEHKSEEVWNVGGAILFASTMDIADELYLTRIGGDFGCTKFFPDFENDFERVSRSEPVTESGITMYFEVWQRSSKKIQR